MMQFLWAFLIGGAFCAVGELLILLTHLTPARILVGYVCAGVVLGAAGIYTPLIAFAGAGATVPLTGFGYLLARGVNEEFYGRGAIGILTGGLSASAAGICAAVLFGLLVGLCFTGKPDSKPKSHKKSIYKRNHS